MGVDYLDKDMSQHLLNSSRYLFENDDASAIAHIFEKFKDTGMQTWHRKTVEWLLVYIMTEIGGTPHNRRKGFNCPSIMDAYDAIVQDLVRLLIAYCADYMKTYICINPTERKNVSAMGAQSSTYHSCVRHLY